MEHLTRDVHAATVYAQTWTFRKNGNSVSFDVLALDREMAEEMGGIVLAGRDCTITEWTLTKNDPRPDASVSRKLAILSIEEPECAELRENEYRRQEDGPSEPDYGAISITERSAMAHRERRELRRLD